MNYKLIFFLTFLLATCGLRAQDISVREHLSMDKNWKFGFGHPYDVRQDYFHATAYFSYITKTGNGDGPAAFDFDDRSWRTLNVPHDWAVEQGFSGDASHSHGYKTVGREFPETSVGWYRKKFTVPESDKGKRISIQFDGIHRDSRIWINGFYLGNESSGYYDINYDITPYLNYGGENVIAVRVDVTFEEGWFYEGAGIYRHVWLNKTDKLHVAYNGSFVKTEVKDNSALLTLETEVENDFYTPKSFTITQNVLDATGNKVATLTEKDISVDAYSMKNLSQTIAFSNPKLWSIEERNMYKLETLIERDGQVVDDYITNFGIRTIRFDANEGFFLNGKHIKIKGTCNHQDHAGVGTAIPDALQDYRILQLKSMGSNGYRAAHNPPTPELLDACDKEGMLVMVENRLLSTAPEAMNRFGRMIKRDRNHPSIVCWSVGNEEWAVEGNEKGSLLSTELQAYGKHLDDTRPYLLAESGGWGHGDVGLDMVGFNYLQHGDAEGHHKNFPEQLCIGSEESNTQGTRGIYYDDFENGHMAFVDRTPGGTRVEYGWNFYDTHPYTAGFFIWTGFDYRGEPNPLNYPAVCSQFGILDMCGFPKEPYYYLRSWWANNDFIKITPHWNLPTGKAGYEGKEGDTIHVRVNSNCDEVELYLNKKLISKQTLAKNGMLNWYVPYQAGTLLAKGFRNGKVVVEDKVETTGAAAAVQLVADRTKIKANGEDISLITVRIADIKGREMPIASNEVSFDISGPAKIIGVGNGDPASHEPDVFFTQVDQLLLDYGKIAVVEDNDQESVKADYDDSSWPTYIKTREQMIYPKEKTVVVRVEFTLPEFTDGTEFTLYAKSVAIDQSIYLNGKLIAETIKRDTLGQVFKLDNNLLKPGKNVLAYKGKALYKRTEWEDLNTDPGLIQIVTPEGQWKRKAFNGLAQVIIQATEEPGTITLKATSPGLKEGEVVINSEKSTIKPFIP